MTDARAVYDPNRLPWLDDDHPTGSRFEAWPLLLWALACALLVAAVGYWAGLSSVTSESVADSPPAPRATVTLPAPAEQRMPQVEPAPVPSVEAAEPPQVRIPGLAAARTQKAPAARKPKRIRNISAPAEARDTELQRVRTEQEPAKSEAAAADAGSDAPKAPAVAPGPPTPWPADVSEGASGRVVRIGTFSTRLQAKRAWWKIVKVYPGMKRLKAVVSPVPSLRNGRTYYRLQFGTTSQAHSTVLCQRMRIVGQSCTVVGLQAEAGKG